MTRLVLLAGLARYALGVAWGYRWMALALLLFWSGQAETWPWTLVQMAADIMLTAMIAHVCGLIRREWLASRHGSVLDLPAPGSLR